MSRHTIPYHATPYHAIPHHTTPHHTIPYHAIPYHTTQFHTMYYHAMLPHTIPPNPNPSTSLPHVIPQLSVGMGGRFANKRSAHSAHSFAPSHSLEFIHRPSCSLTCDQPTPSSCRLRFLVSHSRSPQTSSAWLTSERLGVRAGGRAGGRAGASCLSELMLIRAYRLLCDCYVIAV